jgi:hypothetical protein
MRAGGYAALGEERLAIELLESFLASGQRSGLRVPKARAFWSLRENADFQALLDRHGDG